jgi:hypothetical protein
MLSLPVTVSGTTAQGPFSEDTQTVVVNAHGALVALKAKVTKGQTVCVKSATSQEEQDCQVIWIGPAAESKTQCGLEFTRPSPKFWGVSFPPSDSSTSTAGAMAQSRKK